MRYLDVYSLLSLVSGLLHRFAWKLVWDLGRWAGGRDTMDAAGEQ